MRLAWATDIHLDCVSEDSFFRFVQSIQNAKVDRLLLTGDNSTSRRVLSDLGRLQNRIRIPIDFVLGNHDYWHLTFEATDKVMADYHSLDLTYLTNSEPIHFGDGSYLLGVDGWYDGRAGDYSGSRIRMAELGEIPGLNSMNSFDRLALYQRRADHHTHLISKRVKDVASRAKMIVVATHFPPFPQSCFHFSSPTPSSYLPFYCNLRLGQELLCLAREYPNVQFMVLCGHTHSERAYRPVSNLVCFVGSAIYRHPELQAVLETG